MKNGECGAYHDEQNLSRALIEVHVTPDGETFNLGSVKIGVLRDKPGSSLLGKYGEGLLTMMCKTGKMIKSKT